MNHLPPPAGELRDKGIKLWQDVPTQVAAGGPGTSYPQPKPWKWEGWELAEESGLVVVGCIQDS